MSGAFSLAEQIRRYSFDLRDFFDGAGQRSSLISPLFNTPGRLVCGSHCYFEHLPGLVRQITGHADARELGERMKTVAHVPNFMTANAFMIGYFCGREQVRLLAGLGPDDPLESESVRDTETVVRFWRDIVDVYTEDGLLPSESGHRVRILPPAAIDELAEALRDPGQEERRAVRRAMAVIELYTFILNGEARIGVFHHGPYPLAGGDVLVVKELVGLRQDFLPWRLDRRPAVDAVARVMRLRDVTIKIDAFGTGFWEPFEYEHGIVAEHLLAREGDLLRPLATDELVAAADAAADAQVAMYEQASRWDPVYQVGYGADMYASIADPMGRLAGLDLREEIRSRFHETAARVAEPLQTGEEPLLIISRLGEAGGDVLLSSALPAACDRDRMSA
jgi:hypothetical protein